jgi:hypothetical protein
MESRRISTYGVISPVMEPEVGETFTEAALVAENPSLLTRH